MSDGRMKMIAILLMALVTVIGVMTISTHGTDAGAHNGFEYTADGTYVEITGYTGPTTDGLMVPAGIDGHTVISIGDGAFEDRSDIIGGPIVPDGPYPDDLDTVTVSGIMTSDLHGRSGQLVIVEDHLTIGAGCTVTVDGWFVVREDATVVLDPGSRLVLGPGSHMLVEGTVTVRGASDPGTTDAIVEQGGEVTVPGLLETPVPLTDHGLVNAAMFRDGDGYVYTSVAMAFDIGAERVSVYGTVTIGSDLYIGPGHVLDASDATEIVVEGDVTVTIGEGDGGYGGFRTPVDGRVVVEGVLIAEDLRGSGIDVSSVGCEVVRYDGDRATFTDMRTALDMATNGDVLSLHRDVRVNGDLIIHKGLTLRTDGFSITVTGPMTITVDGMLELDGDTSLSIGDGLTWGKDVTLVVDGIVDAPLGSDLSLFDPDGAMFVHDGRIHLTSISYAADMAPYIDLIAVYGDISAENLYFDSVDGDLILLFEGSLEANSITLVDTSLVFLGDGGFSTRLVLGSGSVYADIDGGTLVVSEEGYHSPDLGTISPGLLVATQRGYVEIATDTDAMLFGDGGTEFAIMEGNEVRLLGGVMPSLYVMGTLVVSDDEFILLEGPVPDEGTSMSYLGVYGDVVSEDGATATVMTELMVDGQSTVDGIDFQGVLATVMAGGDVGGILDGYRHTEFHFDGIHHATMYVDGYELSFSDPVLTMADGVTIQWMDADGYPAEGHVGDLGAVFAVSGGTTSEDVIILMSVVDGMAHIMFSALDGLPIGEGEVTLNYAHTYYDEEFGCMVSETLTMDPLIVRNPNGLTDVRTSIELPDGLDITSVWVVYEGDDGPVVGSNRVLPI